MQEAVTRVEEELRELRLRRQHGLQRVELPALEGAVPPRQVELLRGQIRCDHHKTPK